RGYMQGRSRMAPTAVSQLVEQVAKVVFSLPLAALGLRTGLAQAAAGALLGITIGEALALAYIGIVYLCARPRLSALEQAETGDISSFRTLARQTIRIAVPITIGSTIIPLSGALDAVMITNRLITAGFTREAATSLYGLQSGNALSVVNVVTVLATAICIGLVPLISAARAQNRISDMRRTSSLGLRLASLVGMPSSLGLSMLATPVIALLFYEYPAEEIAITGEILSISAMTILFFTQVQASTGILQGAGWHKIPMISLAVGVLCKAVFNYVLVAIPTVNIFGAPIASLICYGVSMAINVVYIVRVVGMRFDAGGVLVRPGLATAGMGIAVLLITRLLDMSRRWNALVAVVAGGAVYVVLVFAFGALRRDDMDQVPGGARIEKIMIRLGVWNA
ncbi:MAG: polysaccharide biosynthesis C-terminal domain-containing protein, partial [Clostridia bacterium]|nr:polysaccharide biosynthesis C-terminal domain-containing protein [Clostridia bacterium]